jgi:hypothetical protein
MQDGMDLLIAPHGTKAGGLRHTDSDFEWKYLFKGGEKGLSHVSQPVNVVIVWLRVAK